MPSARSLSSALSSVRSPKTRHSRVAVPTISRKPLSSTTCTHPDNFRDFQRRCYSAASASAMTKSDIAAWESGTHESLKQPIRSGKQSLLQIDDYRAPHIGSIKVVKLNDPSSFNALSRTLVAELGAVIESIHLQGPASSLGDEFTRVLILASNMDKAFCAGAHLKERKTMNEEQVRQFLSDMRHMMNRLQALPVATISAVNGAALGGGLELALRTHIRVFASNTVVGLPETRLGIIPGAGGTYRLPDIIGRARALDLALTGRRVKAEEALKLGVCTHLAAPRPEDEKGAVLEEALRVAANIGLAAPIGTKNLIAAMTAPVPNEEEERKAYENVIDTKDRLEALQAFAEKRAPIFRGE